MINYTQCATVGSSGCNPRLMVRGITAACSEAGLTSLSHCAPAPDLSREPWGLWGGVPNVCWGVFNVCWGVFKVCWGAFSVLWLSISAIVRSPFMGDFNKSAKQALQSVKNNNTHREMVSANASTACYQCTHYCKHSLLLIQV